jgi:hypothetical protein
MAAEIPYGAPGDRAFPSHPDREDDTGNSMPGGYPAYRMMEQGIPARMVATLEAFGIVAGLVVPMNRNTPGYCAGGSLFVISSRIIDGEGKRQGKEFPSVSGRRDQWLHGAGGDPMNYKDRGA